MSSSQVTVTSNQINVSIDGSGNVTAIISNTGPQGPQGAKGDPGAPGDNFTAENQDNVSFVPGNIVAVIANGTGVILANASNNNKNAIGIATTGVSVGNPEVVQTNSSISLSDWTLITGSASLSPNTIYYLSTVSGMLSTTPPVSIGNIVQQVGRAINTMTLEIIITQSIVL